MSDMDQIEQDYFAALKLLEEEEDDDFLQSISALSVSQPNLPSPPGFTTEVYPYAHHYYESIGDALVPTAPPEPYYMEVLGRSEQDQSWQVLPTPSEALMPEAGAVMPPPVPPRRRILSVQDRSPRPLSWDFTNKGLRANSSLNLGNNNNSGPDDNWTIRLIDSPEGNNARIACLCASTTALMCAYPHSDPEYNTGLVWGRVFPLHTSLLEAAELTFNVSTPWFSQPLPVPTILNRTVLDFIQEMCTLLDKPASCAEQCLMKLCDSEEYMRNDEILGMYESVQKYHKFSQDMPVRIVQQQDVRNQLSRNAEDDTQPFHLNKVLRSACVFNISRIILQERLQCYRREVKKMLTTQSGNNLNQIVQEVRTICNLLSGVSTVQLEEAIGAVKRISPTMLDPTEMYETETVLVILHQALEKLLYVFFDNFHSDFRVQEASHSLPQADVSTNTATLKFNLAALYKLEHTWLTSMDTFSLSCFLTYGGKNVIEPIVSENISTALAIGNKIRCNRMVVFPIQVRDLPYESMLTFRLQGSKQGKSQELLRWAVLPLYSNKTLISGSTLLSMSMLVEPNTPASPALADLHRQPSGVILQLEFPEQHEWKYVRPVAMPDSVLFTEPCLELKKRIAQICQKHCSHFLTENEQALLWSKRYSCSERSCLLHLLLSVAPQWQPEDLTEIYTILDHWNLRSSEEALFLLSDSFQDQTVRSAAVQYFDRVSDAELEEFLPQLVQALKMEWELDGPLVMLLLKRSLCNIRIAQHLYWLLVDGQEDPHYRGWFSKVVAALKHCCGRLLRQELERESLLVSLLTQTANNIRATDKQRRKDVLTTEKWKIDNFFKGGMSCRLPLDPAILLTGVDMDACKFYNSNAAPLDVSFITADPLGKNVHVICKTGDNLRQDMLVLQIVRVMNRVWLQEGLDMRMVTYRCLSTGKDQGLVEVVPDAVTLAKIHLEFGLGGVLREDSLEKWFHMRNKTWENYEEAVMNFLHSCAGWCVATFVLGICDRHNDNIMIKHSGHMFHIDFGKIMGNAQKFANIKRDRTPFIFSSEMQHFITGGGENPQRFHRFVELCCTAYNGLRRRSTLVLSLLQLMLGAGMPEMKDLQDLQYVHNNLRPHDSELEATAYFTQKIKESMGSFPVKLNFLIHNMVQIPSKKPPPSPVPVQTGSPSTNIQEVVIQKFTVKGKDVNFELRVNIDDGYLISEKTFAQFELIHKKLQKHFIESALPQFPRWFKMSFTAGRKMVLLNKYLKELFEGPCKGNEFVCSLFLDGPATPMKDPGSPSKPQIQLLLSYKDKKLSVMVKHLKNIRLPNGSCPDAYVATRLRPDPNNSSKKKTKVVKNNTNPTFNELIEYNNVLSLHDRVLEVTVKSKKSFVGATNIFLGERKMEVEEWYPLGNCPI
ncbi:phosphatidylinositol 3-kinase C2 domain-containing subunit gamma [Engraulis encrasicolus]|uniref:phosphatidylinositol 3-kinase C2 domain-containing subunit gamma n=1 Tax=Engraulis encrasicolus TaxID=184585 RepID=UPI002FD5C662